MDQPDVVIQHVYKYGQQMEMLAECWGRVGACQVPSYNDPSKNITMMKWSDASKYARSMLDKAMSSGIPDVERLEWLRSRDILVRQRMATLMREGWTAIEALKEALDEYKDQLKPPTRLPTLGAAPGLRVLDGFIDAPPAPYQLGGAAASGAIKRQQPVRSHQYCQVNHNKEQLCDAFNAGKCQFADGTCRKGRHRCNMLTRVGTACNGTHPCHPTHDKLLLEQAPASAAQKYKKGRY